MGLNADELEQPVNTKAAADAARIDIFIVFPLLIVFATPLVKLGLSPCPLALPLKQFVVIIPKNMAALRTKKDSLSEAAREVVVAELMDKFFAPVHMAHDYVGQIDSVERVVLF